MIKKSILIFLLSSIIVFSQNLSRFIDVNGTAKITVDADYMSFVITNKNVSETLQESNNVNTKTNDKLIEIFNEFNLSNNDWEISPIRLGKEYSRSMEEREFVGYYSITNISIKLHRTDDYFSFVERLTEVPNIEIVRSEYGLSDVLKYHKEATIQAAKNAMEKAEYLAESLNLKVGRVIQIEELNKYQSPPSPFNSAITIKSADESITGKIRIVRSISMKVELED